MNIIDGGRTYATSIRKICKYLNAVGIYVEETDEFNEDVEQAIMEFQRKYGITPVTGKINKKTNDRLIKEAKEIMKDSVDDESEDNSFTEENEEKYPHYDSFFSVNAENDVRRSKKDIIIKFGNGKIKKRLIDVYMRSTGTIIDTSGNPVSETYEFIARDLKEAHVKDDKGKYVGEDKEISSSSDIKYVFDGLRNKK